MSGNVVINEEEGNSTIQHKLDLLQYLDLFFMLVVIHFSQV